MFFNFMYDFDVLNANKIMLTTWADNKENNFLMDIASDKRWRNFDDMGNEIRYSPEVLAEFNKNATMWNPTSIGRPICMSYAVERRFVSCVLIQLPSVTPYQVSGRRK